MASEPSRPGSDGVPDQDPPGAPGPQGNQDGQDPAAADAQAAEQAPADEKKKRRSGQAIDQAIQERLGLRIDPVQILEDQE